MNLEQQEAELIDRLRAIAIQLDCSFNLYWKEEKNGFDIQVEAPDSISDILSEKLQEAVEAFNKML